MELMDIMVNREGVVIKCQENKDIKESLKSLSIKEKGRKALQEIKQTKQQKGNMGINMDRLKVTSTSLGSMGVIFMDVFPWFLGVAVGILQIIYLIKKIRSK